MSAAPACAPDNRMTAIAAGGRPDDSAKIVTPPLPALAAPLPPNVFATKSSPCPSVPGYAHPNPIPHAKVRPMAAPHLPARENRLARETSPYLLQHKDNPVDWWPWGPDALAEAKRTGKPILLSVGYAACHWCHVMAHESFEDPAVAAVMNELFINVKVDREERPDIDQIYMSALHLLGEQGGWPLTMFLTPDGEPVWGGTYFPKTARYGRPGFADVLAAIARLFREEPSRIDDNRRTLMAQLAARARPHGGVAIGASELNALAHRIADLFDTTHGGLRGAPKFPQASLLEFLWRAGLRTALPRYFELVELTLDRIANGGIYDHLGGGFSRYSVDELWLVPHFEKMLYDNAQLIELLALAFARSRRPLLRERALETVGWLTREMTTKAGAFCASLDADSEGEEGKFYVWLFSELEDTLGPGDAAFLAAHYGATPEGNFEGRNILNRLKDLPVNTEPNAASEQRLAALRAKLFAARSRRVRPGLDDKVLADWNGLMIAALTNASLLFEAPQLHDIAARAFAFVAQHMTRGERLGHSFRNGVLKYPGLASDFAAMIRAALALFELTADHTYLDHALTWQHALDQHYADPEGSGYFMTADDTTALVVRPNPTADEATPNANALCAQNLIRLAALTGEAAWLVRADRLIEVLRPAASANPFMHCALLNAIDLRVRGAEIVITGGDSAAALTAAALRLPFLDRSVLRVARADALTASYPHYAKLSAAPAPAAFVCVAQTCSLGVHSPDDLAATLAAMRPVPPTA
jgi:uncharacterized protein